MFYLSLLAHILESPAYWEEEKGWCPGIGKGEVHTKEDIQESLALRTQNPPVTREESIESSVMHDAETGSSE